MKKADEITLIQDTVYYFVISSPSDELINKASLILQNRNTEGTTWAVSGEWAKRIRYKNKLLDDNILPKNMSLKSKYKQDILNTHYT